MVDLKVSRVSAEILKADTPSVAVCRTGMQSGASRGAAVDALLSRVSAEVMVSEATKAATSRLGLQAGVNRAGSVDTLLSRVSAEILIGQPVQIAVSRLGMQAGASRDSTVDLALSRISSEVLGLPPAPAVVPAPIISHSFLDCHNWIQGFTMETEAMTSVGISGESERERRRGLRNAPIRTLQVIWEAVDEASSIRLHHAMRDAARAIFQLPLASDQIEASTISGSTITVDTTQGRWFKGARVVIGHSELAQINLVTPTTLELVSPVVGSWPAETPVAPVVDCSLIREPTAVYEHGCLVSLTVNAVEAPGASQLPFLEDFSYSEGSDYRGYPVFRISPDWTSGVSKGISRPGTGSSFSDGRAPSTFTNSDRGRVTHNMEFVTEEPWTLLKFWESRRGRLYPFWKLDEAQDSLIKVTAVDPSFIDFELTTDFDDWKEGMDFIGLELNDGSFVVREAAVIQDVATSYRVTLGDTLTGVSLSDIKYAAIARLTRFSKDVIKEQWISGCVMGTSLATIELLNENPT